MKYFSMAVIAVSILLISACWKEEAQGLGPVASRRHPGGQGGLRLSSSLHWSKKKLGERVQAVGTARARESVEIASRVSDKISRVHFEAVTVSARTNLVSLQTGSDSGNLAVAQAQVKDAERPYIRGEQLAKEKSGGGKPTRYLTQ